MKMEEACRDVNELHPKLRELAQELVRRCEEEGIQVAIGETYRTRNRQDALFEQGRSRPGKIVTYARGISMSSYHQWRMAVDVFINQKGNEYNEKLLRQVGKIGQEIGLEWGGAWQGFVDMAHFQYTGGLSIEDLKRGMHLIENSISPIKKMIMRVDGEVREVEAIGVEGCNFVKLQDLRGPRIGIEYDGIKRCPVLELVLK